MRVFAKTKAKAKILRVRGVHGILAGLVLVICCAMGSQASAVGKGGITISPALKEVMIGSGLLTANTDVSITNNTDQTLNATIKVVDFKALDEFGGVSLGQAGAPVTKYGLANWLSVPSGNNLTLAKGQATDLKIIVDNRADLTPGGHYGAVVVTASSANSPTGNKINFKQELVSLLFLKKLGGEHYGLDLLSLTNKSGPGAIPETINARFRSTGNVHVVPRGFINVTDPKGKLVAKGVINPESTIILPGTERQLTTLMQPVADSSRTGKYKITAYYRYDGQAAFTTKSIYFNHGRWSPERALVGVGIILAIITLAGVYMKQKTPKYRFKRKPIKSPSS